ncbi:MAG TPA: aminoacyl-tRNA hydrolase [Candidatus Saccharimonadales bacterium]|nr:aminoacyl-tRNA hydrolase [Candidatus Saccharimonadales bacterium]
MALFQKKPQVSSSAPLYTLGLNKSVLIVGLGNPAKDYDGTRHNIGFAAVDNFVKQHDLPGWVVKKDLKCLHTSGLIGDKRLIVIKPTTYMNLSGAAVEATAHFYKLTNADILVVHDELDIPFGQIRSRVGGSDAGHNGVKSIIERLGEDFGRIRIGIGNAHQHEGDSADFVLSRFNADEQTQMTNLLKEVNVLITECVAGDSLPADTRSFIL